MSKAFTREDDSATAEPIAPRPASLLPPGTKDLLTPGGALRLRNELQELTTTERPRVAEMAGEDATAKRQLATIDLRIQQIESALSTGVVTGPPKDNESIQFGAIVTVRDHEGEVSTYQLVGVHETDIDRGWVNWLSPIARALMNARAGQQVRVKLPAGEEFLEVLSVRYD